MSEQFWLRMDNTSDAIDVEAKLEKLKVGQEPLLSVERDGCA